MYVSPAQKRRRALLALAGFLLLPVFIAGFLLYRDFRSSAVPEENPQYVRMSDVTETSAVISWTTPDLAVEGWVQYSESSDVPSGSPIAQDERDVMSGSTDERTTHYVTISNLQPAQTYHFVIGSGATKYKSPDGSAFSFTTAAIGSDTIPPPHPVYGTVTNGMDQGAIIYVVLVQDGEKSFPVSAVTNDSGNFEVDLAHIRNAALDSKFSYDDTTEMVIFAQGGDRGGFVERTTVGADAAISMTMTTSYSLDDVFADSSIIDVGEEEPINPDPDPDPDSDPDPDPDQDTDNNAGPGDTDTDNDRDNDSNNDSGSIEPKPEPEVEPEPDSYPSGTPTAKRDVQLTALVLGTSTTGSGITDILVTNVTENSFSVLWSSAAADVGSVTYGTSADNMTGSARDTRDTIVVQNERYVHHVLVTNLVPETEYYYEIHSGTIVYNDNGLPYRITLPATQSSPPDFYSIFGTVTGSGAADAIVFGRITSDSGTSAYASSAVGSGGTWTLSLGGVRTSDYQSYFNFDSSDTLSLTVRTRGNEVTRSYTLEDVEGDEVISTALEMIAPAGSTGTFTRGLYDQVMAGVSQLPDTAVNRLTAVALTVSLVLLGYGTYLLVHVYVSERNARWERDILKDLDI